MEQSPLGVDVGVFAIVPLYNRETILEVSRVPVPLLIGGRTVVGNVEVAVASVAYGAEGLLEVAAPQIAFLIQGGPVGQYMEPAV